jgi:hypothetical protein
MGEFARTLFFHSANLFNMTQPVIKWRGIAVKTAALPLFYIYMLRCFLSDHTIRKEEIR